MQSKRKNEKSWRDIDGAMILWGKKIDYKKGKKTSSFYSYSTTVSSKNDDGSYNNVYLNVRLATEEPLEHEGRADIMIKEAFITTTKGKDDVNRLTVVVLDYDVIKLYEEE